MSKRKFDIEEFLRERDEILLSLDGDYIDTEKLDAYCRKYDMPIPLNNKVVLAGLHKARFHWTKCPADKREDSKRWLKKNGFKLEF